MTTLSDENLQMRALERRLRLQGRLIGLLLMLVIGVVVLGSAPGSFTELRARRFVVLDEKDSPRALVTSQNGVAVFSIFDAKGSARIRLAVLEDGHPEMMFLDDRGAERIRIAERQGAVRVELNDGRGLGQILLGQSGEQFGIDLADESLTPLLQLRPGGDQPQISAMAPDGGGLVQLFAHGKKTGVSISSANRQPGAVLALLENLKPVLLLQDTSKRTVLVPQGALPDAVPTGNTGADINHAAK